MSRLTLRPHIGWPECSNDCVCQNGIWLVPCTDPVCAEYASGYLRGKEPPHYPVPAKINTGIGLFGLPCYLWAIHGMPWEWYVAWYAADEMNK